MSTTDPSQTDDTDAWAAVELVYHAYLTGLILTLVTRADTQRAAEVVFAPFAASSSRASYRV